MELLQAAGQLLGVIVGALLTGATVMLRARAERKRLLAVALSDLLEVRHHVTGIELLLAEAIKRFEVPAEVSLAIRNGISSVFPIEQELHKRYETAVNLLAGVDPILAFYLRSKTSAPQIFTSVRSLAEQNGIAAADTETFERTLSSMVIPGLNEAALTLGRRHSLLTWWRVRRLIKTSNTLPPEIAALIEEIQAMALPTNAPAEQSRA